MVTTWTVLLAILGEIGPCDFRHPLDPQTMKSPSKRCTFSRDGPFPCRSERFMLFSVSRKPKGASRFWIWNVAEIYLPGSFRLWASSQWILIRAKGIGVGYIRETHGSGAFHDWSLLSLSKLGDPVRVDAGLSRLRYSTQALAALRPRRRSEKWEELGGVKASWIFCVWTCAMYIYIHTMYMY